LRPRTKKGAIGELSQAVKQLREALGQTQQQFAQTLHTAITTIARYETGRAPQGRFLARLAEVANQNNLTDLAKSFRDALTRELGVWETTGYDLLIEPKTDTERLYVAAVLAILRTPDHTSAIPPLNKVLSKAAGIAIELLSGAQKSNALRQSARELAKAGKTAEEISSHLQVPVEDVRKFLNWVRLEELIEERRSRGFIQ
jgi:transcriptional regulator with XRE-family HTH domain